MTTDEQNRGFEARLADLSRLFLSIESERIEESIGDNVTFAAETASVERCVFVITSQPESIFW